MKFLVPYNLPCRRWEKYSKKRSSSDLWPWKGGIKRKKSEEILQENCKKKFKIAYASKGWSQMDTENKAYNILPQKHEKRGF